MEEIVLKSNDFLVSQTDAKGRILFANDDFCKVAGYSVEEMIGEQHSLVRHPDMPKAAFKDLWRTIKENKIWTGYVKNQTKDGGFYWVFATIYPMFDEIRGAMTYLSCRRKPSAQEITKAEALYRNLQ